METYLRECLTIREKKLPDRDAPGLFNTKSMLGITSSCSACRAISSEDVFSLQVTVFTELSPASPE